MKKLFKILLILALVAAFLTSNVSATRVLFYEGDKINNKYTINNKYAKFSEALENKGYIVESFKTQITQTGLEQRNPDIIVMPPLKKPLDPEEMAAIFRFIMQQGKSLLVFGETSASNQLTIPFGIEIKEGRLVDSENPIRNFEKGEWIENEQSFVVRRFTNKNDLTSVSAGVGTLAISEANPLLISGDAQAVARGSASCYAPELPEFRKGDYPPIAAASQGGKGLVFVVSDADMIIDEILDSNKYQYDNLNFGLNIINWLEKNKAPPQKNISLKMTAGNLKIIHDHLNAINESLNERNQNLNNQLENRKQERDELTRKVNQKKQLRLCFNSNCIVHYVALAAMVLLLIIMLVLAATKTPKPPESEEEEFEEEDLEDLEDLEESL